MVWISFATFFWNNTGGAQIKASTSNHFEINVSDFEINVIHFEIHVSK